MIEELLEDEPKNYHCWSYRLWFTSTIHNDGILKEELSRMHFLIKSDSWNNSAWSYRYSILMLTNPDRIPEISHNELDYSLQHFDINNESIWNYSRGYA